MNTTDRLYCTHCTFGSSALETASADNAAKVLGYSVRASSLPGSERGRLRQVFRSIERLLSYELPRDASPADKESLDATSAPRRLIFLPLLGDCQVLGQVCYRSHDTAGRPGSYFADMIVSRVDARQSGDAWSPLDCLRLWSASADNTSTRDWWCESEEKLPHEVAGNDAAALPPVTSLAAVWEQGGGPLVTDAAFLQFLNDDSPLSVPDDNAPGVIQMRWKHIPVVKRRELFARLLQATMNVIDRGRETITIAVEPSLAALLFYGICRLLPERLIRHSREHQGISFSTYEPFPERPMTTLVATTFLHDGSAIDLPAEVYQRGFTCNTFVDDFRYGRVIEPGEYVQQVLKVLISEAGSGLARLEALLAAIDSLPRISVRSLDSLIRIDEFVNQYVAGDKPLVEFPNAPRVQSNSEEDVFRRSRFVSAIERRAHEGSTSWPRDLLEVAIAWCGGDLGTLWAGGGSFSHVLRTHLPSGPDAENRLKQLLFQKTGGPAIPDEIALDAVAKVAEQDSRIPSFIADFLKPRGPQSPDWMRRLLQRLHESSREKIVLGSNLSALGKILLEAIDHGGQDHPLVRPAAAEQVLCRVLDDVDRPPDQKWTVLVERAGLLKQVATSRTRLPQTLDRLFEAINDSPPRRLAGKHAAQPAEILKRWADLSSNPQKQKRIIDGWKSLQTVLEPVIAEARKRNERKFSLSGKAGPAEPIKNVVAKLEYLSPAPGFGAWTPQLAAERKRLLQKALESRDIASEDTQLIASWIEPHLQQPEQVFEVAPRRRTFGRELAVGFVIAAVVATAAAGAIVFLQGFSFKDYFPPQVAQNQEKAPPNNTKPPQKKSDPPQSKPGQSGQAAMAEGQAPARSMPSPVPKEPTQSRKTITKEAIGLKLRFDRGKLIAEWDDKSLSGIPFELAVKAPDDPQPHKASTPRQPYEFKATNFGEYIVTLVAKPKNAAEVTIEQKLPLRAPPPPEITGLHLDLASPEKPQITFAVKNAGGLAQYGPPDQLKCRAALGERELGVINLPQKDNSALASFPIDSSWKPNDIRTGKFRLQLKTPQGSTALSNEMVLDRALVEKEISAFLTNQLKQRTVLGVEGVWPVAEKPDPIRLHPFVGPGEVHLALLAPRFRQQDNTQNASLHLLDVGGEEWEVRYPHNDVSHGRFRIARDNPWEPTLQFHAGDNPDAEGLRVANAIAKQPVLLCKLQIFCLSKPQSVQLLSPQAVPPLRLNFQWKQHELRERRADLKTTCALPEAVPLFLRTAHLSPDPVDENHPNTVQVLRDKDTLVLRFKNEPVATCSLHVSSSAGQIELGNLVWHKPPPSYLHELKWRNFMLNLIVVAKSDEQPPDKRATVKVDELNKLLLAKAGKDKDVVLFKNIGSKKDLVCVRDLLKQYEDSYEKIVPAQGADNLSPQQQKDKKDLRFVVSLLEPYAKKDDVLAEFFRALLEYEKLVADYNICFDVMEAGSAADENTDFKEAITVFCCDRTLDPIGFDDPHDPSLKKIKKAN